MNTIENPPIEDTPFESSAGGLTAESTGPDVNPPLAGVGEDFPAGNDNPPIEDGGQESEVTTDSGVVDLQNPPL